VFVAGSAIGFYGSRGDDVLRENEPAGEGFLAGVCEDLEREAVAADEVGVRVVQLRTGVVLSPSGGALEKWARPFRFGLGASIGSGRQWLAWIHIADLTRIILHCLEDRSVSGAVNAVSPNPVTNAEFTRALAETLGRPALLRVPAAALRLGLGELADALLSSQRAVPDRALRSGFTFDLGDLGQALTDCLVSK
jgi:uncharacterized protein (TIGR01777 family)